MVLKLTFPPINPPAAFMNRFVFNPNVTSGAAELPGLTHNNMECMAKLDNPVNGTGRSPYPSGAMLIYPPASPAKRGPRLIPRNKAPSVLELNPCQELT